MGLLCTVFFAISPVNGDDGFVPVDSSSFAYVNGRDFMIAAYAAIFAVLAFYVITLLLREKKISKTIKELENRPASE
jgi:CcmD family protein